MNSEGAWSAEVLPPAAFSAPLDIPGGAGDAPALLPPAASAPMQAPQPPGNRPAAPAVALQLSPSGRPVAQHFQASRPRRAMGAEEEDAFGGHLLGLSTLLVSIGSLVGIRFGGVAGGAAGALFGGAGVNLYRAASFSVKGTVAADREAIVSGTYALAAGALAGYILYRRPKARPAVVSNPGAGGCGSSSVAANGRRSCGIRPIG